MELLGDMGHVESRSVRLEMVLVQDRCTVCAKRTIGSDIVLVAPDGTPMEEAQLEGHFGPFGDSANLDARSVHGFPECSIGSEIVLYAPDRTPT